MEPKEAPARPEKGDWVPIYVTKPENNLGIAPGSGIIGFRSQYQDNAIQNDHNVQVYFEGNLFDAENLNPWVEKVRHAYGRMAVNYPTIAKAHVRASDLIEVGTTNGASVNITNMVLLEEYLESAKKLDTMPTDPTNDIEVRSRPRHRM